MMKMILKNGLAVMLVLALTISPVFASAASKDVNLVSEPIYFEAPATDDHPGESPSNGSNNNEISDPALAGDPALESQTPESSPEVPPTTEGVAGEEGEGPIDPNAQIDDQGDSEGAEGGEQTEDIPVVEDQATDGEQPDEIPQIDSFDMAQFIPNRDFGLFGVNDNGELVSLEGTTLTLGEEYTLAVNFRIDRPVAANVTYTYWLPEVLAGKSGAPADAIGDIATCSVSGNQLRVVFTEAAAEATMDGADSFRLCYQFKEELNAAVVGSDTQFQVGMPTAYGRQTILFNVDGHAADQPEQPEGGVTINRIMPESGIIFAGDTFVVEATVVGFEGVNYQPRWQYDAGDGWVDVEGDGLQQTVVVNDDLSNVNYAWRMVLIIDEGNQTV